jgi:hypothetical protein
MDVVVDQVAHASDTRWRGLGFRLVWPSRSGIPTGLLRGLITFPANETSVLGCVPVYGIVPIQDAVCLLKLPRTDRTRTVLLPPFLGLQAATNHRLVSLVVRQLLVHLAAKGKQEFAIVSSQLLEASPNRVE